MDNQNDDSRYDFVSFDDSDHNVKQAGKLNNKSSTGLLSKVELGDAEFWNGWQWVAGLFGSWLIIFLAVLLLSHGKIAKHLLIFPVMVGHMTYSGGVFGTAILHSLLVWSQAHPFVGLFTYLIFFVLLIICSLVSVIGALFIHASWVHLFSNIISMFLIMICGRLLAISFHEMVSKWFILGLFAMWVPYLGLELVGTFLRLGSHPNPNSWSHWLWISTTPITGASVGIMAVGGFVLIQALKHLRNADMKVWIALAGIIILTLILSINVIHGLHIHISNSVNTALYLADALHVSGWGLGLIIGFTTASSQRYASQGFEG